MTLGLMVSGGLGLELLHYCYQQYQVKAVLTDKQSEGIQEFANLRDIPLFVGNPRHNRLAGFIGTNPVDLLLSINYLFIVERDIIDWPKHGAVNFHGSILPKYRGRTPHVWAIINNEKSTGVTAHLITEGCDEGDIIHQVEVPIHVSDTGASILKKYVQLYPTLVDEVVKRFREADVITKPQDNEKATFFGKRTPEDGRIDWHWQRERIYNWVRAHSDPYPGAFSFIGDQKIIIDWVESDDFGFHQELPNGLVLSDNPVRVKTPNGVVRITKIRSGKEVIKIGAILK